MLLSSDGDGDENGSVAVSASQADGAWRELGRVDGVEEVTAFSASDSRLLMVGIDADGGLPGVAAQNRTDQG